MEVILMELSIEKILEKSHQIEIPEGFKFYSIERALETLKTLQLYEEVLEFYPQNIFTGRMLTFFLFNQEAFTRVSFEDIEEKSDLNLIHIETFKYKDIVSSKYSFSNEYIPFRELTMKLSSGEVIDFKSKKDTNTHWSDRFGKKIEHIYSLIK